MAKSDKITKKKQTALAAAAGEYYVLSQLLLNNFVCALSPQGVRNVDIIISDEDGKHYCSVQVKARSGIGGDNGWMMRDKHEKIDNDKLFYCFVNFGDGKIKPECYIVPNKVVAEVLSKDHQNWLALPGKKGPHKDGSMRRFRPDFSKNLGKDTIYANGWLDKYKDAWDLLRV